MNNFKEYRLRANLNQVQLAERLNVTQACVSRWERGYSYPEIETAKKISAELHISLDAIYNNPTTVNPVEIPIFQSISATGSKRICTRPGAFLQLSYHEMRMLYPRCFRKDGRVPEIDSDQFFGYYNEDTNMIPSVMPDTINVIFKSNQVFRGAIHLVNIDDKDSILVRLTDSSQGVWAMIDSSRNENRLFSTSDVKCNVLKILGVVVQTRQNTLL